ncbi:MAG: SPOR domain-containing protein, partial [Thalassospira sp.]|nr:SPOR domain-containing protein [Thalassospira sp.]
SHSAALGKAQKFVEPVNASDKNTLYRLQAGSWTSRDDAAKVCNTLKAAGTSCLVVAK